MRSLEQFLLAKRRLARRGLSRNPVHRHWLRGGIGCVALASVLIAFGTLAGGFFYSDISSDLPGIQNLPVLLDRESGILLQPTEILDRSGEHVLLLLQQPGVPRRFLPVQPGFSEFFSPQLTQSVIALIEPAFWKSPGFDWKKIRDPHPRTIAEKLVDEILLEDEAPSPKRSLRMRLLAGQITAEFGRTQVLEWYLNSVYFGNLAYGADSASHLYLGKPASELTFQEAALLVSIAQAPALNPFDAPSAARERGEEALETLFVSGYIGMEEYTRARETPLTFRSPPPLGDQIASAFTRTVISQLGSRLGTHTLERGGVTILTTLDYDLQLQMRCALLFQLARVTSGGASSSFLPADENCESARLLPALPSNLETYPVETSASSLLMDNDSGQILAMVGDADWISGEREVLSRHQPGSLLSPFVALAGFARGVNPADLVWDVPGTLSETFSVYLKPEAIFHGPQRLRSALINDYLAPITELLLQIGPQNVWRISESVGLHSLTDSSHPDQLLYAGGELDVLSLSQAYSTFSRLGSQTGYRPLADNGDLTPILIRSASFRNGAGLFPLDSPEDTSIISPQLAFLVHHILADEAARWPSLGYPNPFEIGRPVGAKIGQVAAGNETWAVGYTHQLLNITWVGIPDGLSPTPDIDPRIGAGLWHAILQYASRDIEIEDWPIPQGITLMEVCSPSGKIPTMDCPATVQEVFLSGNEPTEYDDLYRTFEINRETGRLATVFTPPELIQEKTFMRIPPGAEEWANQNKVPGPPTDFDIIQAPAINPDVQITSPDLFAYVRGTIPIRGTAAGDAFKAYTLQAGKGLNPQSWEKIGEASSRVVREGLLGSWQPAEDGLYALRLMVTRNDQRIQTTTIQVTVDTTPPTALVRYPTPGQQFNTTPSLPILFQGEVADTIGVQRVEWYVDQILVGRGSPFPCTFSWNPSAGSHQVVLKAIDFAGNVSSSTPVQFEVK